MCLHVCVGVCIVSAMPAEDRDLGSSGATTWGPLEQVLVPTRLSQWPTSYTSELLRFPSFRHFWVFTCIICFTSFELILILVPQ